MPRSFWITAEPPETVVGGPASVPAACGSDPWDIRAGRLRRGNRHRRSPALAEARTTHGQTCSKALRVLERGRLVARFPGLGYYVC
jgi:hypothetical protein